MSFSFSSKLFLRILLVTALFIPAANGQIVVDSLDDPGLPADGQTTLREAIDQANLTGSVTITFDVSLSGGTIQPLSQLPTITGGGITIDGDLDDDGVPDIEIDGSLAGNSRGIILVSAFNEIRGLVVNRFFDSGIRLSGNVASDNIVAFCYIGVDRTGATALGNGGPALDIVGAPNNDIGPGNIISGNNNSGIVIVGTNSTNNLIVGNFIGTDKFGTAALPNQSLGIFVKDGASSNRIGGFGLYDGNVISGNIDTGIRLYGPNTSGNVIVGNFIGTDIVGTTAISNKGAGIAIDTSADGNTIGPSNLISGNAYGGIQVDNADRQTIYGNWIGVDNTGMSAIPNGSHGIFVGRSQQNVIGPGNVISGNSLVGVALEQDGTCTGSA